MHPLLVILAAAGWASRSQDTALVRLLETHRFPVRLESGRLAGAGGRLLVDEGRAARFFLVGEEHGIAETPQVVEALLRELRPAGYSTFAIEISPLLGDRLDAMARRPGVSAALTGMLGSWYSTVPFYSVAEERRLLEAAMTRQGSLPPMRIWGLDYDISADRMFLTELASLAPPEGKAAVRRAIALADSGFAAVARDHNPTRMFDWSAPDSVFDALRGAFRGRLPARARTIIDVLGRSASINRLFLAGDGYDSNRMRAAFLRENFAKAWAAAERAGPPPRVLFKFGGNHVMRGFNTTNTLDLGTAATVLAEGRGEPAFSVLILGGSGGRAARMNIQSLQYEPAPSSEVDGADLAWLRPAVPDSGWVLFDLRAVRSEYFRRRLPGLDAAQGRVLQGYDAVVILTGSHPGTPVPIGTQPAPAAGTASAQAGAFLERLRASTGTPGVSGAAASKGQLVFSGGAGFIDLENKVPAAGNSVYNIGSVSKAITGVAIMQLLERHRIGLDDDIRIYVPQFPDKGATIRIKHLLTHTSGIRHYRDSDFPGTPDNENRQPIASFLDGLRFFAGDPLLFAPGAFHLYTSYGVNLLQGVVERASGQSFEQYLRENVWQPSGMASAALDIPDQIVPHRARSYRADSGRMLNYYYNDLRYKYASGGMLASVEDLAKFGVAVNHNALLHAGAREQLFSPQTAGLLDFREGAEPQPAARGQGMLWDLRRDPAGRRVAYMCGSVKGSNACIVDFYDEDLVAAIATNSWECCGWSKADSLAAFFREEARLTQGERGNGAVPEVFAPGIVSTGHEFAVTFAPDMREVYFTRNDPAKKRNHIMRSALNHGVWEPPAPIAFSSDDWSDLDPSLSPDGLRMYFISSRPHRAAGGEEARDMDIWFADRTGGGWAAPVHIDVVNSPAKEGSPTVSASGRLCYFSDRDGPEGSNAIFCAERDGTAWAAPERLGPTVNGAGSNTSPFLTPTGDTLLFYSTRPGGAGGADIYMSVRRAAWWEVAVAIGAPVNSPDNEYNPVLSPDGATLYFGRSGKVWSVALPRARSTATAPP